MGFARNESPDGATDTASAGNPTDGGPTAARVRAMFPLPAAATAAVALAGLMVSTLVPAGPLPAQSAAASGGPPNVSARETIPGDSRSRPPSPLALPPVDSTTPDTVAGPTLPDRPWEAWARDALAMASLLTMDRPLRTASQEIRSDATEESAVDRIADRAEWFGDWESSLPWIVGGSLAIGQLTGGARGLREAGALLAGGATASMANEALNRAVGRGRPSWEEGAFSLDPFRGHASFPSGHTAYVFGVASGIDVVTDGWLPAAAAYGVAGLTGLSRIYHDRHWLTDVVASAALSTVVSRMATQQALRVLGVHGDDGADPGARRSAGDRVEGRQDATGTSAPPHPRIEPLMAPHALGVRIRF